MPVNQKRLTSTQTQHLNTARSFRCAPSHNKPLPIAYFSIYVPAFSSDYGQAVRPKPVVRQQINESQVFKYCVCVDSTDTVFIYSTDIVFIYSTATVFIYSTDTVFIYSTDTVFIYSTDSVFIYSTDSLHIFNR